MLPVLDYCPPRVAIVEKLETFTFSGSDQEGPWAISAWYLENPGFDELVSQTETELIVGPVGSQLIGEYTGSVTITDQNEGSATCSFQLFVVESSYANNPP